MSAEGDDSGSTFPPDGGRQPEAASTEDAAASVLVGIEAIWGASPTNVWAVGEHGLAAHFDGATWSTAHIGSGATLHAVHGTATNDVWATGDDGSVLHWDGKAWTTATQSPYASLLGVWANSPSDVWACGADNEFVAGYVLHWDGSSWQEADDSDAATFWRLWSPGTGDVWTVGTSAAGAGVVVHGVGTQLTPVPFDGGQARGVWGTSATDVWVGAYDGSLRHWDGTQWTPKGSPSASAPLLGMAGSGPDDAWAVGVAGTIDHYDGRSWTPLVPPTTDALLAVWSDAPQDAWVAGGSTVLRWDGVTWRTP